MSLAEWFTTLIDDVSEVGVVYIGKATPGSDENKDVWRIQKIVTTWIKSIKYPHWSRAYTQKWSERLSLSYS